MSASTDDLAALEHLAIDLAVAAGALVYEKRPEDLNVRPKSVDTDLVTDMDRRAEAYLRDRLARERPSDPVFGEEADATGGDGRITWVLDPIDGTVNYVYGRPDFAVSVAAVVGDPSVQGNWEPVAGAVTRPASGEIYHARRGGGAYLRGPSGPEVRLAVRHEDRLDLALLATGFAYKAGARELQAEALRTILPQVRDIRRGGSAALDLCELAAGRHDAYYERGVHAWDIAAGWLIATEAGARVTGVWTSQPAREGLVAASPAIHGPLRDLVARAWEAI